MQIKPRKHFILRPGAQEKQISFHYTWNAPPLLIPQRTVNQIRNIQEVLLSPENAVGPLVCLSVLLS